MAEPFYAEIRMFPYTFAPRDWARCEGQLMPVWENQALFSLLGTTYGGDGRNNFGLPNLKGRTPMHPGSGRGLTRRVLGQVTGEPWTTLTLQQLPQHDHGVQVSKKTDPETDTPASNTLPHLLEQINPKALKKAYRNTPDLQKTVAMAPETVSSEGGSQPHLNRQPYLSMYFCIALIGIWPSRS